MIPPDVDTMSLGRLWAIVGVVVGLAGVVIGGLALARSSGRLRAVIAMVAGLLGAVIGGVIVAVSGSGVGTGQGVGGAIVAVVVGLSGAVLGGLALARCLRTRSVHALKLPKATRVGPDAPPARTYVGAMEYFGRTPSPPLDTFVERIWYCSDTPSHKRERVLPGGGTLGLAINLVEAELQIYDPANPASVRAHGGALVSGTATRSYLYDPRQRASVLGVHFRPGGAFPFLGISPSEIVDAHVPLEDLWGSGAQNLREQLLEAGSSSERLRIMEVALLRRLRQARPGHPAVRAAVVALRDGGNGARVADVAAAAGLSRRRFIEVFEREVGLTPKLYARLQRFHVVKQRIASLGAPASWASFAVECGYFDQSHMLRDFVEFSSMSPASYLAGQAEETLFDHVVHAYPRGPGASRPA